MRKINLSLSAILMFLVISGIYCTKQDVNQNERKDGEKVLTLKNKVSPINFKAKAKSNITSKHHLEKSLPVSENEKSTFSINSLNSISCGALTNGQYMDYGSYTYPLQELDFANFSNSTVTILVYAYEVPNNFTILDSDYQIVAQSGWIGTANYSGPWGNALNAEDGGVFTFPVTGNGLYYLQVETFTYPTADYWEIEINCEAAPTQITTSNIGSLHDNTITAIENGFELSGINPNNLSLLQSDNNSKIYHKSYISQQNIDVSHSLIDSTYDWRNKVLGISYLENAIYPNRVNERAIADSFLNLTNSSVLLTTTEKQIISDLFLYYEQLENDIISYSTMKTRIAQLKATWNAQGFDTTLHQGEITKFTLEVADNSVTYWNNYDDGSTTTLMTTTNNSTFAIVAAPIIAWDALGALGGALGAGLDSYANTGKVNWKSVGAWSLSGAIVCSVPATRWWKKFY